MEMPSFSVADEDVNSSRILKTLRFAHPFFVSLSPDNSGQWTTLPDGTLVWRLGIRSSNAYSLNLIFDKFVLPQGGKLYIFDPKLQTVLGAFTHESHDGNGVFATSPIAGDEVIIEYSQEAIIDGKPFILLSAVNHDYKNVFGPATLKAGYFGDSDESCQPDMSCVSGSFPEEKAVCRLIVDGTELCTGTLLNNTRQDGTPFVISASHCLKSGVTNHSFVALFNYQTPHCNTTIEGYKLQTLSGATVVANMPNIDCLLIRLNQTPPKSYFPYFAGWDLTELPVAPYHSIHHPQGDVKKFARATANASIATFSSTQISFDALSHLKVPRWLTGTTEAGSSGCALFTVNGRFIGGLSGGYATCPNPINDYYYRFSKAWEYQPEPSLQLKSWLDPDNAGTTQLNGKDIYEPGTFSRITNRTEGDSAIYVDQTETSVQWMGTNTLGIDAFAERFESVESCTLHGIYLMAGRSSQSGYLRLKVWSEVLFSQNQTPKLDTLVYLSTIKGASENLIMFANEISVKHPVSVSIELPSSQFAAYFQYNTNRTSNTAYLRKEGLWYPFNQVHHNGARTSSYIDLMASEVVANDTSVIDDPSTRIVIFYDRESKKIYLKWGIDYLKQVEVITMNGQTVMVQPFGYSYGNQEAISMSHLPKGIYILKFTFEGVTKAEKVLLSR